MDYLDKLLKDLLDGVAALPDDKMRLELISRKTHGLDPSELACFLDRLYKTDIRNSAAVKARAVLVDADSLRSVLGEHRYKSTYLASINAGLIRVSRLFTDLPPMKTALAGYDKEEEAKMEFLTLGERRALAKGNIKDTLDRLLSDADPVVIGFILDNPRITEKEVLKISSRRPNSPEVIKKVASHRKWSKRYTVVKSIASNPYTPPRLAIALLERLMVQDLKLLAEDGTLHMQVRVAAREAIGGRSG